MKKLTAKIVTAMLALSSIPLMASSAEPTDALQKFDGYIVKLESSKSKRSLKAISEIAKKGEMNSLELSTGNYYHFKPSKSFNKTDLGSLKSKTGVLRVEKNFLIYPLDHEVPEAPPEYIHDAKFRFQWGLRNSGHNNWLGAPAGIDIAAVAAWEQNINSGNIIVAVIDSGIDPTHPDLKNRLWENRTEKNGVAGVDDDGNGLIDDINGYDFHNNDGNPMDGLGHGTHVSGIIGAEPNEIGIRGVMPNVQIMSLKFLSDEGPGSIKNAIKCVDYAIRNGARIINNSWGSNNYSETMLELIQVANAKNILFVAAAGNKNENNDTKAHYPGNYEVDNVISVGALNAKDTKASFSNFGKSTVDIFAPGISIVSTEKDHAYRWKSGTSMAAPMVSGALGLLLAENPGLSVTQAKERLLATTSSAGNYLEFGKSGRLNIDRLLRNDRSQD